MGSALSALRQTAGSGTQAPRCLPLQWQSSVGGVLAVPLPQTARRGDLRTQGLWAHPILGACAHVAPRARLPLFHFRPPLPCAWAAAMRSSGAAGLLPWLHRKTSTGRKTGRKRRQPHKDIVDRARGVCSAPHPQSLSCQRATCTPQVLWTKWLTRWGTEAQGVQPPTGQPYPCRQCKHHAKGNSARWGRPHPATTLEQLPKNGFKT